MKGNQEGFKEAVIKNAFYNSITSVISKIGTIIFTIIIARVLLPESFGIYNLAISVPMLLLGIGDLGINNSLITYVSNKLARRKFKEAAAYFNYLQKIKIYSIFLLFLLSLALAYPTSNFLFHKPQLFVPTIFASFYLLAAGLESFYSSAFFAFNKAKYISYKETIFQFSRILLITLIFLFMAKYFYVLGVISSLVISNVLVVLLYLIWIRKFYPGMLQDRGAEIDKKSLLKFVGYLAIANLSAIFFIYVDIIVLGAFVSDASYLGFYKAATALAISLVGVFSFTNSILPAFSMVVNKHVNYFFNQLVKYVLIISIPATFGLIVLGKYFIKAIFGQAYLPAAIPLSFVSFIIIEGSITAVYISILTSKGKPWLYLKPLVSAAILNFLLLLVLIYSLLRVSNLWAITGAAIATLTSRFFYLFYLVYISKKEMQLAINPYLIIKPFFAAVVMSAVLIVINLVIKDMSLYTGIIEVFIGVIVYFSVIFAVKGIRRQDINLIKYLKK